MTTAAKAQTLVGLYDAPEILRVVNVWDVVSARAVAALPETKAIATPVTASPRPSATTTGTPRATS